MRRFSQNFTQMKRILVPHGHVFGASGTAANEACQAQHLLGRSIISEEVLKIPEFL